MQATLVASGGPLHNVRDTLEPMLYKMRNMPGIDPKSFQTMMLPDFGTIVSTLAPIAASWNEIAAAWGNLSSAFSPSPPGQGPKPAQPAQPILQRRHGPGEEMQEGKSIVGSGILKTMDSRLLVAKEIAHPKLAEALEKAMPKHLEDGQLRVHFNSGRKVAQNGNNTSVNPYWRETMIHVIATGVGAPGKAPLSVQSLRDIAPNTGAYHNEVRS